MKISRSIAVTALFLTILPSMSMGATESLTGKVKATFTDTTYFGYCMLYAPGMTPSINCPANYFSADCKGSFNSKETTRLVWDAVQLSYAMDSTVIAVINDAKKHNGHCVIDRIQVVK